MHLVNMNCTLWGRIILYIYLCIAVLSRHLHTFRRKSFAFFPLYLAHIILYTCIQYVRTWGSIGLPGCNFFTFTPPLPTPHHQHLTVLMFSRRHRLPGARGSRSAAHGDRRRRAPEPCKEKLVSTGWLSISGTVYTYIHTYYMRVGTTRYIVSFFPSYGFLFIFFLSAQT